MSKYQDHVRQSLEGQNTEPSDGLGTDAMRWTPAPANADVTAEALRTAADAAHMLIERAADAYVSLVNGVLGDGTHHMVASASTPHGALIEVQELTVAGDSLAINEAVSVRLCAVIAAAMTKHGTGGLVIRTFAPDGSESVRGWRIRSLWLRPLTAQEIQQAYTVNHVTGAQLEAEPGVEYRQAERVPPPEPGPHEWRERQHRAPGQPAPEPPQLSTLVRAGPPTGPDGTAPVVPGFRCERQLTRHQHDQE